MTLSLLLVIISRKYNRILYIFLHKKYALKNELAENDIVEKSDEYLASEKGRHVGAKDPNIDALRPYENTSTSVSEKDPRRKTLVRDGVRRRGEISMRKMCGDETE